MVRPDRRTVMLRSVRRRPIQFPTTVPFRKSEEVSEGIRRHAATARCDAMSRASGSAQLGRSRPLMYRSRFGAAAGALTALSRDPDNPRGHRRS